MIIDCNWKEDMCFEAHIDGHSLVLDAPVASGGNNLGPKPKSLLLAGLAGCTGMDVVSILKKMHVHLTYFNVKVDGHLTEEHPTYFNDIKIIYQFKGDNLDLAKLEKAVNLSQEKYCGVSKQLSSSATISYEIELL